MKLFTKFWFKQYNFSNTCRELANNLNGKVIKQVGSRYRKRPGQVLINWGSSEEDGRDYDLNKPHNVGIAVNKLDTFRVLQAANVTVPKWSLDKNEALLWGTKILGRDSIIGKGGEGIIVYKEGQKLRDHKFYTSYFKKQREFRIHVFNDEVIFIQEKLKKRGVEVDKYVRSHNRGWCFAFRHLDAKPVPNVVLQIARNAVRSVGLNFGAVDCGWNDINGGCVFEINTAPGLENSSLEAYVKAINEL